MKKKGKVLTEEELKEFGAEYDCIPPSKRAQSLREKLEKDTAKSLPANINDLWNRFQEMNETQSDTGSSLNTSRIESLTNLLRNPTRHFVQRALDERTYQKVKERRVNEEIAALEREQRRDLVDTRREELVKIRKQIRDDESNGSYAEIIAERERQKVKPRVAEKEKSKKEKENINKGSRSDVKKLGDSADTLYSIPEDTSFEGSRRSSPNVNEVKQQDRVSKSRQKRQRHVIDPLMSKLKDKVQRQRDKIDKERRKELKRMDKLKKLEMLLTAKRKGHLTDKAIGIELENVSTTSVPVSDESTTFMDSTESTLTGPSVLSDDSNRATIDTTSSKDSSLELQKTRSKKTRMVGRSEYDAPQQLDDSESQSDIIIVRKPRKSKSEKQGAGKDRKTRKDHKLKRESSPKLRKDKGRYSPERRIHESVSPSREKFRMETSPVRGKLIRDVGTMYPSPIVVSPPRHRQRSGKVCVKSEAVQTDGRTRSPPYSDIGVISVPSMSPDRRGRSASPSISARGRPRSSIVHQSKPSKSRSPRRSVTPDSTANTSVIFNRSYSPPRSRSPTMRSRSNESKNRSRSPPKSRMFIPESDSEYEKYLVSTPPKNRMFTPETPDEEYAGKVRDSPSEYNLSVKNVPKCKKSFLLSFLLAHLSRRLK